MNKTLDVILTLIATLAVVALIVVLIVLAAYGTHDEALGTNLTNGWYYALTTQVVEIDTENDVVTVEDSNGNLWDFYGVEDWEIGDCASLLMNSRGTEKVTDDRVEGAQYSAWTLTQ